MDVFGVPGVGSSRPSPRTLVSSQIPLLAQVATEPCAQSAFPQHWGGSRNPPSRPVIRALHPLQASKHSFCDHSTLGASSVSATGGCPWPTEGLVACTVVVHIRDCVELSSQRLTMQGPVQWTADLPTRTVGICAVAQRSCSHPP